MPERILSEIVELDIDRCGNVFGVDPCTAGRVNSGNAQGQSALLFDGIDDYVLIGGQAWHGVGNQPFSFEIWAQFDASDTTGNIIHVASQDNGLGWCTPFLTLEAGKVTARVWNSGSVAAADPSVISYDVPHHLVATWSTSTGLRLYVDGVQVAHNTVSQYTASGAVNRFHLARDPGSCSASQGWLKCRLDSFRAYDRALSAQDVAERFNGEYRDESGLRGHWSLNDGTGTTAADSSGYGNNGSLVGGPSWVSDFNAHRTLRLAAGASAVNDAYNGKTIRLGDGRERRVLDYDGGSRVATLSQDWAIYLELPGTSGNYASTPDSVAVSITGDIDLRIKVALDDWTPTNGPRLICKRNADTTFDFLINPTDGRLVFYNGSTSVMSTVAPVVADGEAKWLRVTVSESGSVSTCNFYTSDDGATWTLLGAADRTGSSNRVDNATPVTIGMFGNGTSLPLAGKVYYAEIRDGIAGTVVCAFDPGDGATNDTLVTSSTTGEVWTINQSGDPAAKLWGTPTASTTYTVIDRPNACYNTFRTCVDKPNYLKGVQTIKFTGTGSPVPKGQGVRPYIKRLATAPTEIDPEEGLAVRASSTITLVDEACADTEFDAYIASRTAAARGTFWTRFLARNLNFAGRPARVKRAFVAGGVWGTTTTERFIIESIKGPNAGGEVQLTLKDPIKLADRGKAPVPTTGKLSLPLLINDLSMTLYAGEGAQYATSGHVRIGDEIIQFTGRSGDVLSWPDGTYRAKFGTAAADAAVDDVVQQCLVYTDQAFSAVIEDLLNRAGIADADIDLAQLAAEEATWLGDDFRVTAVITDPEDIADLIKELLQQSNSVMWWSPTEQKVKFKVYAPQSPAEIGAVALDDTAHVVENSVSTERLEAERITRAAIYFDLRTPIDDIGEAKNFKTGEIAVDTDAEGPNEYNEARPRTIYSRWFGPANTQAMRNLVRRYVARYRDAPERIEFTLDPKDGAHKEGDVLDLETRWLVDESGAVRTARILITRREPHGVDVKYAARVTNFDRPYGFIAPNGTPDYPNNNGYACVSDNNGRMSDGSQGYLII